MCRSDASVKRRNEVLEAKKETFKMPKNRFARVSYYGEEDSNHVFNQRGRFMRAG